MSVQQPSFKARLQTYLTADRNDAKMNLVFLIIGVICGVILAVPYPLATDFMKFLASLILGLLILSQVWLLIRGRLAKKNTGK